MLNPAAVTVADIFCANAERGGRASVGNRPGKISRPGVRTPDAFELVRRRTFEE
jgi:hypothetical protein